MLTAENKEKLQSDVAAARDLIRGTETWLRSLDPESRRFLLANLLLANKALKNIAAALDGSLNQTRLDLLTDSSIAWLMHRHAVMAGWADAESQQMIEDFTDAVDDLTPEGEESFDPSF